MRALVVLLLVALFSIVPVAVCYAHDEAGAGEGAAAVVESPVAEKLAKDVVDDWWGYLELRSGVLWNVAREEWTGYASVPVIGYKALTLEAGLEINPNEDEGPTGGIVALTYDVGDLRDFGVDVSWAEHFGVNVGPFLRYDFGSAELEGGVVMSVIDLSFGNKDANR